MIQGFFEDGANFKRWPLGLFHCAFWAPLARNLEPVVEVMVKATAMSQADNSVSVGYSNNGSDKEDCGA